MWDENTTGDDENIPFSAPSDYFYRNLLTNAGSEDTYIQPPNAGSEDTFYIPNAGSEDTYTPTSSGGGSNFVDMVDNPQDTTSGEGFTTPVEILNEAKVGEPGYGWKYYTDGTAISPTGKYYFQGNEVYDASTGNMSGVLGQLSKLFGPQTASKLKSLFVNPDNTVNLGGLAGLALGAYSAFGGGNTPKTGGYKGTVPKYTAVREAVAPRQYTPYSGGPAMGRRYFSSTSYLPSSDTAGIASAREALSQQAEALGKVAPAIAAPVPAPAPASAAQKIMSPEQMMALQRSKLEEPEMATGGIANLRSGRYLRGATDGMADKIPSSIDDKQPAKLSHGEFVIPADVVSHLGNGNSDAGAKVLYNMMDRVRKARTGTKKQGKQINPSKFTPGGIAQYAGGGAVAFQTGGTTSPGTTSTAPTTANPLGGTTEQGLAPYVGDYVTDMLGRAQGLAKEGYTAYQGPLSAGTSPLQEKGLSMAGTLGGGFDASQLGQYMNPYIQSSLQPQLAEMRRQAEISQQGLSGKFAQAGAFGGARDAIARAEGIRGLLAQQQGVIGNAYRDAFDKAMSQYNVGQQQKLSELGAIMGAGEKQRDIEQQKINAERAQFEEERLDPYQKLKFEQSMLQGLPLASTSTTPNTSTIGNISTGMSEMIKLYDMLKKLGIG